MKKTWLFLLGFGLAAAGLAAPFDADTLKTPHGQIVLTFIGHGTLMMQFDTLVVHIDPVSAYADYQLLPQADLVLITHAHGDHLDPKALAHVVSSHTTLVTAPVCKPAVPEAILLENGQTRTLQGIEIEAVPAYNLLHLNKNQQPFHPRGEGNGYILRYDGISIYVAGDTENTPEMKALQGIDIAFLPMNLPYTMTPEMVADAARAFRPRILYPYHYGNTDVSRLTALLGPDDNLEIRIRNLK